MRPSLVLESKREEVRALVRRYRASNPRVFGSVVHGTDREDSDLDLLIDPAPDTTLFELGGLQVQLEELLGCCVDLVTPGELHARIRDRVIAEARPL